MRLWHEDIIHILPRQQLLGQHRECCALRGLGWNRRHATVDYVFQYSPYILFLYHSKVMYEMKRRGYHNNPLWEDPAYRGEKCAPYEEIAVEEPNQPLYAEHDDTYMKECLANLNAKGIYIT